MVEQIDKYAKKYDLNRSKLIQNILSLGIEEMKIVDSIGIVKLTLMLKEVKEQYDMVTTNPKAGQEGDNNQPRTVSVSLEESLLREIEAYAEKLNFTRNNFIERLIATGLHDMGLLRKTGLMNFAVVVRSLQDKWRKTFQETKQSLDTGEVKLKNGDK
ncbi:MAG TPA: hypothetical protein PLK94_04635 [Alphaproteobacteria bacterium]|nr:hypothetical protein [Alphaproteobacteria bacterium]